MSGERRRALLEALALGLPLAIGVALQKLAGKGVEHYALGFFACVLGIAFAAWVSARGRARPLPGWVIALVPIAGTGFLLGYPPPRWTLLMGGLGAFAVALPALRPGPPRTDRATRLDEAIVGAFFVAAVLSLGADLTHSSTAKLALHASLALLIAAEAWTPRAARTAEAAARRAASLALLAAAGAVRDYFPPGMLPPPLEPELAFLSLATVATVGARLEASEVRLGWRVREAALVFGPVLLGAIVEKVSGKGVEAFAIAFGLVALGLAPAVWLSRTDRAPRLPLGTVVLVPIAGAGFLFGYPLPRGSLVLVGLGAFAVAMPGLRRGEPRPERATLEEEAPVIALALVAAFATWIALARSSEPAPPVACALLAVLLALESWGPRAARTVEAAIRRSAAFGLIAASAATHGYAPPGAFPLLLEPELALLTLAATAVLAAAQDASEPAGPGP